MIVCFLYNKRGIFIFFQSAEFEFHNYDAHIIELVLLPFPEIYKVTLSSL
jgi:hypothetical protein